MAKVSSLTTSELAKVNTALDMLVDLTEKLGLLEPAVTGKLATLAADVAAEIDDRQETANRSRRAAVAARRDPMEHYSA